MHPITWLVLFTLIVVLALGAWQWRSVRISQRNRRETKAEGHPFGPDS
jgi:cytochrome oxidase assembly protein ShyY1